MIKLIWTVLCLRSIVDKSSNNVSLIDVLEEVKLEQVIPRNKVESPILVPFPFYWVTLWARREDGRPGRGQVKDVIMSPSGKTVRESEYEVDLSKYKRYRFMRRLDGLPVGESGQYKFRTQVKDEKLGIWEDASVVPLEISIETREAT